MNPRIVFICERKHFSALMIRHSRSFKNGSRLAGGGTSRHGIKSSAAFAKSIRALTGGIGRPLITSISGLMSFKILSKHSMLASSGAIWSIRFTVRPQSVGNPFERSESALMLPPVGSCTFSGFGRGSLIWSHGGIPSASCKLASTLISSSGMTYLDRVVIWQHYAPIAGAGKRDHRRGDFQQRDTFDADFSVRHCDAIAVRIFDDQRSFIAGNRSGIEHTDLVTIARLKPPLPDRLGRRLAISVPHGANHDGNASAAVFEGDKDFIAGIGNEK